MASAKYAVRDLSKCTKDCICLYVCPTGASDTENGQVDKDKCIGCGACAMACPSKAISILPRVYPKEQVHELSVINALRSLAESKVKQELMLKGMEANSSAARTLKEAFRMSNRIMAEDLLRESGYLIPQGVETIKFLDDLYTKTKQEDVKKLILMLDEKHVFKKEETSGKKWRCMICGYIHEGDTPPEVCPNCGVPGDMFEPYEE